MADDPKPAQQAQPQPAAGGGENKVDTAATTTQGATHPPPPIPEKPKKDFFPEIAEVIVIAAAKKAAAGDTSIDPFHEMQQAAQNLSITRMDALARYAPDVAATIDNNNLNPWKRVPPYAKNFFKDPNQDGKVTSAEINRAFKHQATNLLEETAEGLNDAALSHSELCEGFSLANIKVDFLTSTPQYENDRRTFTHNEDAVVLDNIITADETLRKAQSREETDIVRIRKAAAQALKLKECTATNVDPDHEVMVPTTPASQPKGPVKTKASNGKQ